MATRAELARVGAIAAACVIFSSGCQDGGKDGRAETVQVDRLADLGPGDVLSKDHGVGRGCTVAGVVEVLHDFVDAIEHDDGPRIRGRLGDDFKWYSVKEPGKPNLSLFQPDDVVDYASQRTESNQEMELFAVRVGDSEEPKVANVVFGVAITSDDVDGDVGVAFGKGAVACDRGDLVVLSMGVEARSKGVGYVAGDFDLSRERVNALVDQILVSG